MTHDLHTVRSRLREIPLEPAEAAGPLRRLLDQHRGLVQWLTTPLGRRNDRPSRT